MGPIGYNLDLSAMMDSLRTLILRDSTLPQINMQVRAGTCTEDSSLRRSPSPLPCYLEECNSLEEALSRNELVSGFSIFWEMRRFQGPDGTVDDRNPA